MTPDQLVQRLSGYLEEMTQVIASYGGTVDKFVGDAITAFWGAPLELGDHAARACAAAMQSQRRLAELRVAADTPWQVRIGIATGEVLVGNIGSRQRFNYTVMGDTVNLASRLEGLNKVYGTTVLISESTYRSAQERLVARPVDIVQVKGKQQHVRVYEPLGLASERNEVASELAAVFTEGLEAYVARDFRSAMISFERILKAHPHDRPAALQLERCRRFMVQAPPQDWDGVYVAEVK